MMTILGFYVPFLSAKDFFFFSSVFDFDSFSLFLVGIIPLVYVLISLSSFQTLSNSIDSLYRQAFFSISLLLCLCFLSNSMFLFLVLFESCVFFMLILIFNFSKSWDKISSTSFMFLLNILGSFPFMLMISFPYPLHSSPGNCSFFYFWGLLFFSLLLLSKLPAFLIHFWLTKAHVSASGCSSMILASLLLKIGSLGLFKFMGNFSSLCVPLTEVSSSFSLTGAFIFSGVMLRFFDFKYLIACSSILHMSFMFPLAVSLSSAGTLASMLMMVGHGLLSYFLFFLLTLLYEYSHNRSMDFSKSAESHSSLLSLTLFLFLLLNLGFPPTLTFFSEVFCCFFFSGFSLFSLIFFLLILLSSVFSFLFSMTKILFGKKHIFLASPFSGFAQFWSSSFLWFLLVVPFLFS